MTSHWILPPGGARKRKEREAACFPSGPPAAAAPTTTAYSANARKAGDSKPMSSNGLLAGYMAHEFLTRGTLFGQKLESGGATCSSSGWAQRSTIRKEDKSRAEMASIVKSDGTHIPGVVNPSELSRWMQI